MNFLREILKKYKKDDEGIGINSKKNRKMRKIIDNKYEDIYEIIEEIFPDLELDDIFSASLFVEITDFPVPMGTNFCSIFNPLQSANAIIPDIFRRAFIQDPEQFSSLRRATTAIPKWKIKFDDATGSAITIKLQKLIPDDLIRALFYFGYKSDWEKTDSNLINMLEINLEKIIEKSASNVSNYTDPNTIFDELYDSDTLIQSILQFDNKLNIVTSEQTDLTNIGSINLNYLFTYYSAMWVTYNNFIINKSEIYNSKNDKSNTALSYSDLIFLNYVKNLINDNISLENFLLIMENNVLNTDIDTDTILKLKKYISFIKNNNIFLIINIALEVKQHILKVISYNLNNKIYHIENYAKPEFLKITQKIYDNYTVNEKFLNSHNN